MSTETEITTYAVAGMTCGHCERAVNAAVSAVAGVTSARADQAAGTLAITGTADDEAIAAAVADAGYELVR